MQVSGVNVAAPPAGHVASDSNLAQILESTLLANRTMEHYSKQEKAIQQLTPEAVQAAFKKRIDIKHLLTVVAGDWKAGSSAACTACSASCSLIPARSNDGRLSEIYGNS